MAGFELRHYFGLLSLLIFVAQPINCEGIPTMRISEEDGLCPKDWWRRVQKCYRNYSSNAYTDGKQLCEDNGGHLVTPNSLTQNNFVQDLMDHLGLVECYLGLIKTPPDVSYFWITDERFEFQSWHKDAVTQGELSSVVCASMQIDGFWYTNNCDESKPVICEQLIKSGRVCGVSKKFNF